MVVIIGDNGSIIIPNVVRIDEYNEWVEVNSLDFIMIEIWVSIDA